MQFPFRALLSALAIAIAVTLSPASATAQVDTAAVYDQCNCRATHVWVPRPGHNHIMRDEALVRKDSLTAEDVAALRRARRPVPRVALIQLERVTVTRARTTEAALNGGFAFGGGNAVTGEVAVAIPIGSALGLSLEGIGRVYQQDAPRVYDVNGGLYGTLDVGDLRGKLGGGYAQSEFIGCECEPNFTASSPFVGVGMELRASPLALGVFGRKALGTYSDEFGGFIAADRLVGPLGVQLTVTSISGFQPEGEEKYQDGAVLVGLNGRLSF